MLSAGAPCTYSDDEIETVGVSTGTLGALDGDSSARCDGVALLEPGHIRLRFSLHQALHNQLVAFLFDGRLLKELRRFTISVYKIRSDS